MSTPSDQSAIHPPSSDRAAPIRSSLGGDPDMLELIQLFVEEIPERVRTIQDFWQRKELVELRRVAHQMKGASGGYGFPTIGEAAARLEHELNRSVDARATADLSAIAGQIDDLVNHCNRVRAT